MTDMEFDILKYFQNNNAYGPTMLWRLIDGKTVFEKEVVYETFYSLKKRKIIQGLSPQMLEDPCKITELGLLLYRAEKNRREELEILKDLNVRVARSTNRNNVWSPLFAGVAALFAVLTFCRECNNKTEDLSKSHQQIQQSVDDSIKF